MKTRYLLFLLNCSFSVLAADSPPPVYQMAQASPGQTGSKSTAVATVPPAATSAPPPAGPPKRSAADLEKLLAPIALYPDPLLATVLPASVYPLEIVQAARFVADTNNLAKLDAQPWDASVKAVARVPDAIKKLNEDISWTIELGEAFLAQDKDVMDMIQALRGKAQKAGTLQTTPQQIVVVTNMVIEKTVEQQVVIVTNTIVQIQPASSSVVYVPTYNPYTVYYPPYGYVYNPYAPLIGFGVAVGVGFIIANNCDWHHGGCYHGGGDVNIDIDRNVNRDSTRNVNRDGTGANRASTTSAQNKWQPDQSRLNKSGSPTAAASARSAEARGWGSSGARPSTGTAGARPSTGTAGTRPSTGTPSANRPSPSTGVSRPAPSTSGSRPSPSPSASPSRSSSSYSRPSSSGSAYGGMSSGSRARSSSSRGMSSRGGGGGRGGGGRR